MEGVSRRGLLGGAAAIATLVSKASSAKPSLHRSGPDVVVVGAGVFGAWIARTLQQHGAKVTLLDAWGAAHSRASSGGETRLIRTEYGADPLYTAWAWHSLGEWKALSGHHESRIFHETGALYLYPKETTLNDESVALQRRLGVPIETLSPSDLVRRWPQIDFDGIGLGVLQPTMGVLMARRAVQLVVSDFVKAGGTFEQVAVDPPTAVSPKLKAVSGSGRQFRADHFIFACGPWLPKLFADVGSRIVPIRKDVFFFTPKAGDRRFCPPAMPAWVDAGSPDLQYGFPDLEGRGFKIALDGPGERVDPDVVDRRVSDSALADVRSYLKRRFPDLATAPLSEQRVCQYENTDDRNFLIDRHPRLDNVWIAGGGSGHGFKHGPAVGRYVWELAFNDRTPERRFTFQAHRPYEPNRGNG